jgi:DnaJ domain
MEKATLTPIINERISQIALEHSIAISVLEDFADFVVKNYKKKSLLKPTKKPKALAVAQLKESVCKYFQVKGTPALKKNGSYQMATEGMDLNLSLKESWEILYRKFIGLLPHEEGEEGVDCLNGINIFKYFMPWKVFGLDPKFASDQDIKNSYRNLSKIYHPDNPETGNARIFDRINSMYQSITIKIS